MWRTPPKNNFQGVSSYHSDVSKRDRLLCESSPSSCEMYVNFKNEWMYVVTFYNFSCYSDDSYNCTHNLIWTLHCYVICNNF